MRDLPGLGESVCGEAGRRCFSTTSDTISRRDLACARSRRYVLPALRLNDRAIMDDGFSGTVMPCAADDHAEAQGAGIGQQPAIPAQRPIRQNEYGRWEHGCSWATQLKSLRSFCRSTLPPPGLEIVFSKEGSIRGGI